VQLYEPTMIALGGCLCVCKHMDCINRVIAQREGWYLVDKAEFVLQ